jgi:serine/threonine protein kinase
MLTPNQILQKGRFSVVKSLGHNGFGESYEAFDNISNTNVLIKEIPESLNKVTTISQLESRKHAFAEKAKVLTELKHDTLLPADDFFSEVNHHYLVMKKSDGSMLSGLIEMKKSAFPPNNVVGWALKLLDAVHYLHRQTPPLYHLDIRPENLLLTPDGEIKLFTHNIIEHTGLKKYVISEDEQFDPANLPFSPLEQIWEGLDLASQKVILNSFEPEAQRILQQPPDAGSDIYAVGATLYYLLTARLPFDSLTRLLDILDGNDDPLPAPHKLNPNIPSEISEVLMKALELKREDRFASAAFMQQSLKTALARVMERELQADTRREEENVLEIPVFKPAAAKEPGEVKRFEGEQKRQIELMKKQLREAEERRSAAERRAAEAERLLLEKENQTSLRPDPAVSKIISDVEQSDPAEVPKAETKPAVEPKIAAPEKPDEAGPEVSAELFNSLSEETGGKSRSLMKAVAGVFILLIIGGGAFGIWHFYVQRSGMAKQNTSNEQPTTPAQKVETAPLPSPETAQETPADAAEIPAFTEEPTETSDPVQPNASQPVRTEPAAVQNAPKRNTPAVKSEPTPAAAVKPAATPKPVKPKNNSVTLDDLLEDN